MDDDDTTTSTEGDAETCMVVEIQENELGELMLVERPREQVFANNRFCVVDCEIETSEAEPSEASIKTESLPDNIEIVYLPDYGNPSNGPVLLKQELLLHSENGQDEYVVPDCENYEVVGDENEKFLPIHPEISPKVYKRNHKRTFAEIEPALKKPTNGVIPKNKTQWKQSRTRSNPNVVLNHQRVFQTRSGSWSRNLDTKDFVHPKSISSVTTIHTKPKSESVHQTMPDSGMTVLNDIEEGPKRTLNTMPHKCQYCDRSFRQSVSLQIHSTLHSQSIPDGCLVS